MDPLWSGVISAVAGFIAGAIGSLVAPWVHWSVEKRREKTRYRREIIQRCREKIESPQFTKQWFRSTQEYRYLKPLLSKNAIEGIERDLTMLAGSLSEDSWNPYRRLLLEAVEKLEKNWDLV
jgi:hypothetical protein